MTETTEVETKARKMGWLPKEEFRGKTEHWVDADKYVERGDQFIPFLQADRKRLEAELAATKGELTQLKTTVQEATETIEALKEFRTELNKERVVELQETLVEGIKAAREAGDVEKEEELRSKLSDAKAALKDPPKPEPKPEPKADDTDWTKTPAWGEFISSNPWWNDDPAMRAAAVAITTEMAKKGELDNMSQAERLAKVAVITKKRFGVDEPPPRRGSDVDGGRGGSSNREPQTEEKSYRDLPADARDGCSRFESRLVGKKPGQFPTLEAYRKHYTQEYFRRNPNG